MHLLQPYVLSYKLGSEIRIAYGSLLVDRKCITHVTYYLVLYIFSDSFNPLLLLLLLVLIFTIASFYRFLPWLLHILYCKQRADHSLRQLYKMSCYVTFNMKTAACKQFDDHPLCLGIVSDLEVGVIM